MMGALLLLVVGVLGCGIVIAAIVAAVWVIVQERSKT